MSVVVDDGGVPIVYAVLRRSTNPTDVAAGLVDISRTQVVGAVFHLVYSTIGWLVAISSRCGLMVVLGSDEVVERYYWCNVGVLLLNVGPGECRWDGIDRQ